jgi:hypothetical protein
MRRSSITSTRRRPFASSCRARWRAPRGRGGSTAGARSSGSSGHYSTSAEVQTDAKPQVVKSQRTPNKSGSGSLRMERAQRGVKMAQPDTPAGHGSCPTERAGGEPVTGRGWHGADARVWPRGLRGALERGAPGRGGDDGRDGGGCMHPDAGRPCCGPERRSDPSAGQVRAAARRFCCPPHGSPHPSLKKHHQHILFRRGCLAEWGIRCCCRRDGDAVLTCAPCGVAGCLSVADTRRPGNAQDSQGRRRLSSACRAFGHGRLHRRAHASGPA